MFEIFLLLLNFLFVHFAGKKNTWFLLDILKLNVIFAFETTSFYLYF